MSIQDKLRQDFGFHNFIEACQAAKQLKLELKSKDDQISRLKKALELAKKELSEIEDNCHTMDDMTYCFKAGKALEQIKILLEGV